MSITNSRSGRNTYFNKDEILHLQSFEHISGSVNKQDARTRFAYVVVSKTEAKKIAGSLDDDAKVLASLRNMN